MLPNFFIVGAAKAGTTSLSNYLNQHYQIFMSQMKEPNYFAQKDINIFPIYGRINVVRSQRRYESLFKGGERYPIRGEASVAYLLYYEIARNILDTCPDSKILIILRNPVDRCISHYHMDDRLGFVKYPLERIVSMDNSIPHVNLYFQQYIGAGVYSVQVRRYLDVFGKDRVFIALYEDLLDIKKLLAKICRFLDIDPMFEFRSNIRHNEAMLPRNKVIAAMYKNRIFREVARGLGVNKASVKEKFISAGKKKPQKHNREVLLSFYLEDICALENIIERDLSIWKLQDDNVTKI